MEPADRKRLKRRVLDRGRDVAERLTKLLAGQNIELKDILLPEEQKPGERPEEKLRRLLDRINRVIRSFDDGTFGTCHVCGEPIAPAELEESPWTGIHRGCLARGLGGSTG